MLSLLAQQLEKQSAGELRGIGPLGFENATPSAAPMLFEQVLSRIVGVMVASAIIWFLFQFIIGAIQWIGAGGDQKAIEGARARLTNAIIGIVIALAALVLISVIGFLFGIEILNIKDFIEKLAPGEPKG